MTESIAAAEAIRLKRRLRMKIGRLRRRINSRLAGGRWEARRLLSWRTYVKRYPAGSLTAAFAAGLAASTGLRGPRLLRSLSALLVRRGTNAVADGLRTELRRVWEESTPRPRAGQSEPQAAGADHGER